MQGREGERRRKEEGRKKEGTGQEKALDNENGTEGRSRMHSVVMGLFLSLAW